MKMIQQIVEELAKNIVEKALDGGLSDLDALAASIFEDCADSARNILEEIVRLSNELLRDDKAFRKKQGLLLKERNRPRQILTKLGVIEFTRDDYFDKNAGKYVYPLDQMLGVRSYERIGDEVVADLLSHAAEMSYAKSSKYATGGAVSRQSVRQHLLGIEVPEKEPLEEGKSVKVLHIHADEDHVAMQRPGKKRGKKSRINPLVTVTEGTTTSGTRRNRTICSRHFVEERQSTKGVWASVAGYLCKAYDIDGIETIYVHGDGANWIKGGLDGFGQVVPVADGYHFGKELRRAARACPGRNIKSEVLDAIRGNDRKRADELLREMEDGGCDPFFRSYLFGQWEAIRNLVTLNLPGSCTEGQVSHVLSERFRRSPMGWSREGLGKLNKLRVYLYDGGKLTGADIKPKERLTIKSQDLK